jgi:hypothetical protein
MDEQHGPGYCPTWKKATPQERADAVIIHEKTERGILLYNDDNEPHEGALIRGAKDAEKLPVSDNTKQILKEMDQNYKWKDKPDRREKLAQYLDQHPHGTGPYQLPP